MSLSEHKDGVGASAMEPECHVLSVMVSLECGGYEWDKEDRTVPSVGTLEEFEQAAILESVEEIRKRRLEGGSEDNGYSSSTGKKIAVHQYHHV